METKISMSNQSRSHRLIQKVTQHDNSRKVVDFMSEQAVRQMELKQICFVDDSKTSAYVTKKLLSKQGFSVDHFADAETALEALMENEYDLVITDLMISPDGGVNGDDLIRLIRHSGHPKKSLIPIMVVTGASDASVYDDLIVAGANRVLPKPLNEEALHEAIVALTPKVVEFGPADELSLTEENEVAETALKEAQQEKIVAPEIEIPSAQALPKTTAKVEEKTVDLFVRSGLLDLELNAENKEETTPKASVQSKPTEANPITEAEPVAPKQKTRQQDKKQRAHKSASSKLAASKLEAPKSEVPKSEVPKPEMPVQRRATPKPPALEPEFDIPVLTSIVNAKVPETPPEKEQIKTQTHELRFEEVDEKVTITSRQNNFKPKSLVQNDEISPSMLLSIQNELTHIDELAAHNAELEKKLASLQSSQPATQKSAAQKLIARQSEVQQAAPASKVSVPDPVATSIPEPAVHKAQPVVAATPTPIGKEEPLENNPLLDLLSHMDQPNSNGTLSAPNSGKTNVVTNAGRPAGGMSTSFWIVLILIMTVPAGVFWYLSEQAVEVKVVEVNQAAIHSEISVPGRVVSKRNIKVSARAAGQIVEIKVKEGTKIKKGQIMARMDDKEAKSNVKRAQARLISSQEDVAATSKTQERLLRALDLGAVSRQIVEDAEAAWKSASAKQAEIEEELIGAELKLDRLQIKAPFSGLITSLSVQEGQWLSIAEPILSIVDMSRRVVEIRVDVSDSARLNVGQEVILSSEAFDGKTWNEKITKIGAEAQTEGAVNIIKVHTSLGRKAPKLRIGQQVDAEIRVASKNNALLLPHNVLFTHNGSPHAAVVENAKIVFIPVVTGIESVLQVEILKGLRLGQEIIVPTGTPLEQGMNAIVTNSQRTIN